MQKFFNWLVLSSADPTQASVTIRGILGGVATALLMTAGVTHLHLGSDQLNMIVDLVTQLVTALLGVISGVAFVLGLIRKIHLTMLSKPGA